jgi:dolichol-phosphate mannosyltransferase
VSPALPAAVPSLSVVVPTYNERGRLSELVAETFDVFGRHALDGELVIVDDNSPDGTGVLADALASEYHPRIRVVHRAGKLGLGTAVVEGFSAASSEVVGVMDADLSHPPERLPRMLEALRSTDADFVIGSRYVRGGGTRNWGAGRVWMSRLACLLARPITPVRDATSGFFLVRREVARHVRITAGGFKICLELLVRGQARSVVEVPYVFVGRTVGESKMNVREAAGYLLQLIELFKHRHFGEGKPFRQSHRVMGPA